MLRVMTINVQYLRKLSIIRYSIYFFFYSFLILKTFSSNRNAYERLKKSNIVLKYVIFKNTFCHYIIYILYILYIVHIIIIIIFN